MKNLNYKTLLPALVAAGVLVYEAWTGNKVSPSIQSQMVNDGLSFLGVIGTIWGIVKDHKKG